MKSGFLPAPKLLSGGMHFVTPRKVQPIIPIVPLLDILAILLIFFMLTTTFKERKEYLPIEIPRVTHLRTASETEPRVALEVLPNGEMRLAEAPVNMHGLAGALRRVKESLPDAKLELRADNQIPLQTLLEIWEALTKAEYSIREVPVRVQVSLEAE